MKPFFLTTIPKSGTHLVVQFMKLVGYQRTEFSEQRYVERFERLYFHRNHTDVYRKATGLDVGEHTIGEAERDYRDALEASTSQLRGISEGSYAFYHVPYDRELVRRLRELGLPIVFLHRDPRDVAFSLTHHILRRPAGCKYEALAALPRDEDRYAAVIRGTGPRGRQLPLLPLAYLFERYEGWLGEPDVLVLRYEDIIGPRGGGDADAQYASYARLAAHIGLDLPRAELVAHVDSIYSESAPFFVNGRIGQWRTKMTPRLEGAFRDSLVGTIERWTGEDGWCEKSWSWGFLERARRRWLGS